jgi:hypothetical protein
VIVIVPIVHVKGDIDERIGPAIHTPEVFREQGGFATPARVRFFTFGKKLRAGSICARVEMGHMEGTATGTEDQMVPVSVLDSVDSESHRCIGPAFEGSEGFDSAEKSCAILFVVESFCARGWFQGCVLEDKVWAA